MAEFVESHGDVVEAFIAVESGRKNNREILWEAITETHASWSEREGIRQEAEEGGSGVRRADLGAVFEWMAGIIVLGDRKVAEF